MSSTQKRTYIIAGIVLALIALGVWAYILARPTVTSEHWAQAKRTLVLSQCAEESPSLHLSSSDRQQVEFAAITHLIDVPAGTNVDVKVASFSKDKVTGSDRYPAKYGSYNFTLTKQGSDWHITRFQRCN